MQTNFVCITYVFDFKKKYAIIGVGLSLVESKGGVIVEVLEGYVERIVYRNAENGYTVLILTNDDIEMTVVGTFTFISEGEYIKVTGDYTKHQMYGEQLVAKSYEVKEPEDLFSIERYLGSGAIKGVKKALAARIVRKFKKENVLYY